MDLKRLKDAIAGRVRPIGSWASNRLNLARDAAGVRTFDFGPGQVREVKELMARYKVARPQIRSVNWLVPYVEHPLFAGVHTILRFADYFSRAKAIQNKIVIYNSSESAVRSLQNKIGKAFPGLADNVCALGRLGPGGLPPSDISIATCWQSAYFLLKVKNTTGKFYFVQDFEPLFYPAGTTYGLVEATYRMGYWGVVNTNCLGELLRSSYNMTVASFQPAVDRKIFYPSSDRTSEPVKIFFYGRPGNPRNGFVLGIEALKKVKEQFGERVQIVSAGGRWNPSDFGAKGMIENLGMLTTIEAVAALYRSCHIGLVFMFTKHPSYQPIEMMASGVCVVTNDNDATKWFMINGKNSLVVEPTITSVSQAISLLVSDSKYRNGLATEGLRTAGQTSWETEIEGVHEFLVGGGSMESLDSGRPLLFNAKL